MRHYRLYLIGLFAGLLAVASVLASRRTEALDQATNADLRCLILALNVSSSKNVAQKQVGLVQTLYYLGRYDAHAGSANLEAAIVNEMGRMKGVNMQTESKRCGSYVQSRGVALQALGKVLMTGQH